jgi:hypothetical protein
VVSTNHLAFILVGLILTRLDYTVFWHEKYIMQYGHQGRKHVAFFHETNVYIIIIAASIYIYIYLFWSIRVDFSKSWRDMEEDRMLFHLTLHACNCVKGRQIELEVVDCGVGGVAFVKGLYRKQEHLAR